MKSFKDKKVLITGAGKGLGRELSIQLYDEGASLILLDRDSEALERLKLVMPNAAYWNLDLKDFKKIEEKIKELESLDVLINNAAVVFGGAFDQSSLEEIELTYEVNVVSPSKLIRICLPLFKQRPEAHIINITSASALISFPYAASYGSSKWAVLGLSETLQDELEDQGWRNISITAACPSYIQTEMFRGAKAPRFTKFLDARSLATGILQAARKKKFFYSSPWIVKWIPFLRALLPYFVFRRLLRAFGVHSGMKTWAGRASTRKTA